MHVDQEKGTQLSNILGYIGEELDIPEDVYQEVRRKHMDLGDWLKEDHLEHNQSDAEIYPQGSLRLGTAVRPVKEENEYDVDLVYRRDIQKESTTQEELKRDLEEQLKRYLRYLADGGSEVPELVPGRRCWTLDYKGQFHMDILPALPDDEAAEHNRRDAEDGIIIPDTELRCWQHSNPKGYANWFDNQQAVLLQERRDAMAKAANVDVEEIPRQRVPTPLRRAVQILKCHRDMYYQGNPKDRPISIIITTLAADAYRGESDVFEALMAITAGMRDGIKTHNDEYWVPNPINPKENFADKWREETQRAERFFEWLQQVETDFSSATKQAGLHKIADSLSPVLGVEIVGRAFKKYGSAMDKRQQDGQLRMAAKTGLLGTAGATVKPNTWYGE